MEMPADILKVRFLLGGGFKINLSRFAAIATRSSPTKRMTNIIIEALKISRYKMLYHRRVTY